MTSKEFAKQIMKIRKETNVQLKNLDTIKISGDEMTNTDMEKTIKSQGYQKIEELIRRLSNG
ncbi:MAG: hypothetical protein WC934_13645 [Acidithiobacillus sp.]|jgi:hypothetical protein|uniref:hypothetical protein n=1 Tax=Acidithiobacillus sp. TaxID=1872118 RepID=UPI00355E9D47